MSTRILNDARADMAALYCSTSDFAFGPVFYASRELHKDAEERAEAFLRWMNDKSPKAGWLFGRFDVRNLRDDEMVRLYGEWRAQEAEQYRREEAAEREAAEAE